MYLKCDAVGCDHVEFHEGHITLGMIGKECPKCGANLLTEEDYYAGLELEQYLELLDSLGLVKLLGVNEEIPDGYSRVGINPHKGKINVTFGGP